MLGVFQEKIVFAIVATAGIVMASVYALRMFIAAMHNRVPPTARSREMSVADGVVLVPLVILILALALYPQIALSKGERAVTTAVSAAQDAAGQPARAEVTP